MANERLIVRHKLPYRKTKASPEYLLHRKGGYNKKIRRTKQLALGNKNVRVLLRGILNEWRSKNINFKYLAFWRETGGTQYSMIRRIKI